LQVSCPPCLADLYSPLATAAGVLRVYVVSIAVRANNFKFASGKAAARPMKIPLYGTPTGSILRQLLEDKA